MDPDRDPVSDAARRETIGVICSAHQAEGTIDQMLASLAGQTRPPDQVIVVDDASLDGTADRARAWSDRLPLEVIVTGTNLGPGPARHLGVGHLTTDLVAPLDADDVALPDHLAALSEHLRPGRHAVACSGYYWTPGRPLEDFSRRSRLRLDPDRQLHQLLVTNRLLNAGLFRRSDYDAAGGFEDMAHEDWGLWVHLVIAGVSISVCPVGTFLYRQHAASLTTDPQRRAALDTAAFEQLIVVAEEHLPADEIDEIRAERARVLARLAVQDKLTSGDVVGAKAIARSVSTDGDRTLWAISHLPAPLIGAARAIKNMSLENRSIKGTSIKSTGRC